MSSPADRKVTVNEADLREMQECGSGASGAVKRRVRAALDALGPEPCGQPSAHHPDIGPAFRCVPPARDNWAYGYQAVVA